jgi:hypothetical protein
LQEVIARSSFFFNARVLQLFNAIIP